MSNSDDAPAPVGNQFSSLRILKRPEILKLYATSIRRFCRSNGNVRDVNTILRGIFEIFRDRISDYWENNQIPRSNCAYSKFMEYCRSHLFGHKYAIYHCKFLNTKRVGEQLDDFIRTRVFLRVARQYLDDDEVRVSFFYCAEPVFVTSGLV